MEQGNAARRANNKPSGASGKTTANIGSVKEELSVAKKAAKKAAPKKAAAKKATKATKKATKKG